ncbi:MAG: Dihydropteroate synthase [Candidatus Eisenbacteria bacterium]
MIWRCRDVEYELSQRVLVMGIVNVTPDSFSDGGRWLEPDAAVAHCHALLAEGADLADLLDLGAESTRPGSPAVPADEQWRRLEPVLVRLACERPDAVISCDTRDATVAERALAAGARVVNDVSALGDPRMAGVVARARAGMVLMHMRGTPETMQRDTRYDDVVAEVGAHLADRRHELLARLHELTQAGRPVLVGASRKSFLARLTGDDGPPDRRVAASLAAATVAVLGGARILRVHDVADTVRAVRVAVAVRDARR